MNMIQGDVGCCFDLNVSKHVAFSHFLKVSEKPTNVQVMKNTSVVALQCGNKNVIDDKWHVWFRYTNGHARYTNDFARDKDNHYLTIHDTRTNTIKKSRLNFYVFIVRLKTTAINWRSLPGSSGLVDRITIVQADIGLGDATPNSKSQKSLSNF